MPETFQPGEIHGMQRLVIPLHVRDLLRQMLLQLDPVRGVFTDGLSVGQRGGAGLALVREQTLGLFRVGAAISFFDLRKLVGVARCRGEYVRRTREPIVVQCGGRQRVEQRGLGGEIARHFVLRRGELLLRAGERTPLAGDLRADVAREIVQSGEPHQSHQAGDYRRRDL